MSVYPDDVDVSCGIGQHAEGSDGHIDLCAMRRRTEREKQLMKSNRNEYAIELMEILPIEQVAGLVMLESEGIVYDHYRNGIDVCMRRCLVVMKGTAEMKVRYIDLDNFMNRAGLSRVI